MSLSIKTAGPGTSKHRLSKSVSMPMQEADMELQFSEK